MFQLRGASGRLGDKLATSVVVCVAFGRECLMRLAVADCASVCPSPTRPHPHLAVVKRSDTE